MLTINLIHVYCMCSILYSHVLFVADSRSRAKNSANSIEQQSSVARQQSQHTQASGPLPVKLKRELLFLSAFDITHKTYKVTHFDSRLALMIADTIRCVLIPIFN